MIAAALIKDNKVHCRKCEKQLNSSRIFDYKTVSVGNSDETYTQFIRECSHCKTKIQYCVKMGVDFHNYYSFENEILEEVRRGD